MANGTYGVLVANGVHPAVIGNAGAMVADAVLSLRRELDKDEHSLLINQYIINVDVEVAKAATTKANDLTREALHTASRSRRGEDHVKARDYNTGAGYHSGNGSHDLAAADHKQAALALADLTDIKGRQLEGPVADRLWKASDAHWQAHVAHSSVGDRPRDEQGRFTSNADDDSDGLAPGGGVWRTVGGRAIFITGDGEFHPGGPGTPTVDPKELFKGGIGKGHGPSEDQTHATGRGTAGEHLDVARSVLQGKLDDAKSKLYENLPGPVKAVVSKLLQGEHWMEGAFKANQRLAVEIAKEAGHPDHVVEKITYALNAIDTVARNANWKVPETAGAAVGGPVGYVAGLVAAKASYYLPTASVAYVGYHMAKAALSGKNPFKMIAAARVKVREHLAKTPTNHVRARLSTNEIGDLEGGRWVTTDGGYHVYIKDGEIIAGNPHVVARMKTGSTNWAQKKEVSRATRGVDLAATRAERVQKSLEKTKADLKRAKTPEDKARAKTRLDTAADKLSHLRDEHQSAKDRAVTAGHELAKSEIALRETEKNQPQPREDGDTRPPTETEHGDERGQEGSGRVQEPHGEAGRQVEGEAGRSGTETADRTGGGHGQSSGPPTTSVAGPPIPERVAASLDRVNEKLDRYEKTFRESGDHKSAELVGMLRDHVNQVGVHAALEAISGGTNEGEKGDGQKTKYEGWWEDEGGSVKMGDWAETYLDRHGLSLLKAGEDDRSTRTISSSTPSQGGRDEYHKGDFTPKDPTLKDKLEESKALPGLEKSEDINVLMGKSVTHLTPDVTAKLDTHYGQGKWIVKAYGDEAAAGYGIYFPQRAAQVKQDAQNTLWSAGGEVAKYGFSLRRDESGTVVGLEHHSGDRYDFGTDKYRNTIDGDVRHWGDKAATAAEHEHGAALPGKGKDFMAQPAFDAVGISDADRAAGVTIKYGTESRVHIATRDGKAEIIPHSTWVKGDHLPVVFENEQTRAMAQSALDAVNALPASERQGHIYAPDVMLAKDGYKVVEVNPANKTGSSGYLGDNPFIIDSYASHLTGREPAHVAFVRSLLTTRKGKGRTDNTVFSPGMMAAAIIRVRQHLATQVTNHQGTLTTNCNGDTKCRPCQTRNKRRRGK